MRNVYLYFTLFIKDHKIEGEEKKGEFSISDSYYVFKSVAVME